MAATVADAVVVGAGVIGGRTSRQPLAGVDPDRYWPPRRIDDPAFWDDARGTLSASWTPDGGFVDDPALAATNLATSARRRGVRFFFGRSVIGVSTKGVRLDDGSEVHAPIVVNAAGRWSGALRLAGVGAEWTVSTRPMRQEVHDQLKKTSS